MHLYTYTKQVAVHGDTKARAPTLYFYCRRKYNPKNWKSQGRVRKPHEKHCCSIPCHFHMKPAVLAAPHSLAESFFLLWQETLANHSWWCNWFAFHEVALQWDPSGPWCQSPKTGLFYPFGFWGLSLPHNLQTGTEGLTAWDQHEDKAAIKSYKGQQSNSQAPSQYGQDIQHPWVAEKHLAFP